MRNRRLDDLRAKWDARGLTPAQRKPYEEESARLICNGEPLPDFLVEAITTTTPADRGRSRDDRLVIERLTVLLWQMGDAESPDVNHRRAAAKWLIEDGHHFGTGDPTETLRKTWERHGEDFLNAIRIVLPRL